MPALTRQAAPAARAPADGHHPAVPAPVARQARRGMFWLGLAMAAAGALAAAWLVTATGHRQPVLALARAVPAGAVITPADLTVADIAAAGIVTIPARQENQVAGLTAAASLQAGTLLAPGDLTSAAVPGPGQQLVPVPLHAADLPASGLAPGDQVLVIATPGSGGQAASAAGAGTILPAGGVPATVYQVSPPDASGDVTADLIVTAAGGVPVAEQASTGQVAVIVTRRAG